MNGQRLNQKKIVGELLRWFGCHARDLPWRRTCDPYAIWVSEIMLQQTQVKTVVPYWERWMRALPTIEALGRAGPRTIHKLWEGLGYYARVRNMQKAARVVCKRHGGKFPEKFEEVLALPGIGPYTAGAICSIAFNQPKPILDGNVIRVLSRVFGIGGNPRAKETNKQLWGIAEELVVEAEGSHALSRSCARNRRRSKSEEEDEKDDEDDGQQLAPRSCSHLNQSLMELGALVCRAKDPQCGICPVAKHCAALRENRVEELPNLSKRARTTQRRFVAFVAQENGRVLVRQRPAGVMNAHLWEFPNMEVGRNEGDAGAAALETLGFRPRTLEPLCMIKHSITRYRMTLEVFRAGREWAADGVREKPLKRLKKPWRGRNTGLKPGVNERGPSRWLKRRELARLAFCSAHKKILEQL